MNKEELTRELKYTEEKHKNDVLNSFDTNISMMCSDTLKVLNNCIEIPENATNGDVIMACFPHLHVRIFYTNVYCGLNTFPKDWWNAPYKREGE